MEFIFTCEINEVYCKNDINTYCYNFRTLSVGYVSYGIIKKYFV